MPPSNPDYAAALSALHAQQSSNPLSILTLSAPLTATTNAPAPLSNTTVSAFSPPRPSDASSSSNPEPPTPVSLAADLSHYKDLFSKLRFSYLEQVTKEKYLRSIVGDPPLLVSHAENVALENKLAVTKAELKEKKEAVGALVEEMEGLARELARRWDGVRVQTAVLEELPGRILELEGMVQVLRQQQASREGAGLAASSADPRMNLSLDETTDLVAMQQERSRELDRQIAALERQMPAKVRECECVDRELERMEGKRNEAARMAMEAKKVKEEGGRDELEEKGRWYRSAEMVLRSVVGVDA